VDVLDTRTAPPDAPERPPERDPLPAPRYGAGRATLLLVLVVVLQLGFVGAYLSTVAAPPMQNLPVAVVASDPAVARVQDASSEPARTIDHPDRQSALQAVQDRSAYAALVPDGANGVELRIATSQSEPVAQALVRAYGAAGMNSGVRTVIFDEYAPPPDESRSIAPFFLVVGWVLGGFLAATALAIALGSVPATPRRVQVRVLALLAYALVAGVANAVLVGPGMDLWSSDSLALGTFGAMVTFGAAMTAAALQSWFGLIGAGLGIALFVLLATPGALPAGWLGDPQAWTLPGAGTQLVRGALYPGSGAGAAELVTVWLYCFGGAVGFLVGGHVRPGRLRRLLVQQ
jgi:hypothetical protein